MADNEEKRKRWERGFQDWSDRKSQDEKTGFGKCGNSSICDYCESVCQQKPCVSALNAMLEDKKITIDYSKKNYEAVWRL